MAKAKKKELEEKYERKNVCSAYDFETCSDHKGIPKISMALLCSRA